MRRGLRWRRFLRNVPELHSSAFVGEKDVSKSLLLKGLPK